MAVHVVTDSASDLPRADSAALGITVVPLTVRIGGEEHADGSLTPTDFWARCDRSPSLPETAAPSPGAFEEAFRAAAAAGATGIVCVTISSALSATYQSAQIAAEAVKDLVEVRVVDSRTVSMGEGLLARDGAAAAAAGADLATIADQLADAARRTRLYAALDTLENLKKGGRIGSAQALLGSLLSIKPVIQVKDGVVEAESKQRTRTRALAHLVDAVRAAGPIDKLSVVHALAPDIEEFLDQLDPVYPRERVLLGDIGAVIGAHAGPRVLGVTFQVSPA